MTVTLLKEPSQMTDSLERSGDQAILKNRIWFLYASTLAPQSPAN